MGRLFGTDGVRGIANRELTVELAFKLGQAGAQVLRAQEGHKPKIIVGMDTRLSGGMLESSFVAGICSVGANAICVGVIPTPAVAYLTRYYNADAGVVISASHNPFEFNGIKFFNRLGFKLPDAVEEKIEKIILDGDEDIQLAHGASIGTREYHHSGIDDYIAFLKKGISSDFKELKVAVDCANGAVYEVVPKMLRELGATVMVLSDTPDGININAQCGSTHMENLQNFVVKQGCHIGLAFDGDGDRVLVVDEKGDFVDGDKILAMIALDLKRKGKFKKNTLVATVMSNLGLDVMAKREGIHIEKTKVGDRYVLENMIENGFVVGGEQSGHIILLEHNTTGDGPLTGLVLLEILKNSGKKISELASVMEIFPQVLKNAKVSSQKKNLFRQDEWIEKKCKELEAEFSGEGRVLIRQSGTEPLVRVMIEGKNLDTITKRAEELVELIEKRLS
jgi:phosphoglucosamine mutase